MQGLGFRVYGPLGFRVWGSELPKEFELKPPEYGETEIDMVFL